MLRRAPVIAIGGAIGEEHKHHSPMDGDGSAHAEGTSKAKGWSGEDLEVVEEDGWRRDDDGIKEGHFAEHARLEPDSDRDAGIDF